MPLCVSAEGVHAQSQDLCMIAGSPCCVVWLQGVCVCECLRAGVQCVASTGV